MNPLSLRMSTSKVHTITGTGKVRTLLPISFAQCPFMALQGTDGIRETFASISDFCRIYKDFADHDDILHLTIGSWCQRRKAEFKFEYRYLEVE